MHDLTSFDFPGLSHIWCHTGAYFRFRSRFVDPLWFAWSSLVSRYMPSWGFGFILSWFIRTDWIYLWCHTGAYSLLQLRRWSFSHISITTFTIRPRDVVFALWVTVLVIFIGMSFQCSMTFEFWLSHYPWFFLGRLLYWDHSDYPIRSFF